MSETKKTYTAFTLRRGGKSAHRWIEIGNANRDDNGAVHVMLEVLPIGGFSGYVYLAPEGEGPPAVEPAARRPSGAPSDDRDD